MAFDGWLDQVVQDRTQRGRMAHASGAAAEDQVAQHYCRAGHVVAATRWRGRGGEIDLVIRDGAAVIFVEVKRARDIARAAERVTPRQVARLQAAAAEFLGMEPAGELTDARFDVALVDGTGRITVLENALM